MPLKVTVKTPQTSLVHLIEFDMPSVRVGRSADCDLRLPYSVVSAHHLTILCMDGATYQVRDEGSTNGTLLNGQRLPPGQATALSDGARLRIVDLEMELDLSDKPGVAPPMAETSTLMHLMLVDALRGESDEFAYIEVIRGPAKGQRVSLGPGTESITIGATPAATLRVGKMKVTLQVTREDDAFWLRPLAAPAGGVDEMPPTVNGQPLRGACCLNSEDEIRVGGSQFRFVDPLAALLAAFDDGPHVEKTDTVQHDALTAPGLTESPPALAIDGGQAPAGPPTPRGTAASPAVGPPARTLGFVELFLLFASVALIGAVAYLFYLFLAA